MNKCPKCGSKTSNETKTIAEIISCDKCDWKSIIYPDSKKCCLFPNLKPVRYYSDEIEEMQGSDKFVIFNQCQSCGKKVGQAISKQNFINVKLPLFDSQLAEQTNNIQDELRQLSILLQKNKFQNQRDTFWDDYNDYLKSDRWKQIRKIALQRDNYLCQSCFVEKATQVHHLDSRFRKNEPIYTLVSVCDRCHEIITEIERGGHNSVEKINYKFDKDKNSEM